jgi:hypothetical protein
MNAKIQNYQSFFLDQVKEAESERITIVKTPMNQLFRRSELIVGYIDCVNDRLGHVIIRFPKNTAPRLKVQLSMTVITKMAKKELGERVTGWTCTFYDFWRNGQYHQGASDILPLYYLKQDNPNYDYVGCTAVSLYLYDKFKEAIALGKQLTVLLYTPFPPVDYFNNMAHFLEDYSDLPELLLEPRMSYEDWHPEELAYNPAHETAIADRIMQTLKEEYCCILQGPPGSGKSYTIAQIVAHYLDNQKTVCVTTMANKGLIELVNQKPLLPFLEAWRISKSNLTIDEQREAKGLKSAPKGFCVPAGELFCSTNYVLSQVYNPNNSVDSQLPNYDLVVIEEASQAFLSAIVAFKRLGIRCLIVGDPMQLPPIITSPNKALYKAWNVHTQMEGLRTMALGSDIKSYRIVTTFRLTPASAALTGIFYDNRFQSVQQVPLDFSLCPSEYFPKEGGAIYQCTNNFVDGVMSDGALKIIAQILYQMMSYYPERSIAIITPFKDSVKTLQKHFLKENHLDNITIETIDRIQGITVDYAIVYFPARGAGFGLDERHFNVATSRSRSTTLILSDVPLEHILYDLPYVATFLDRCPRVDVGVTADYSSELLDLETQLEQHNVKALYPGEEALVDLLIQHHIPFSQDGEVELLDEAGQVIATAGMLLKDYALAIDPVDEASRRAFEAHGYETTTSEAFHIDMLKPINRS